MIPYDFVATFDDGSYIGGGDGDDFGDTEMTPMAYICTSVETEIPVFSPGPQAEAKSNTYG